MDKRPRTIKSMFDQIAPTYDLVNHILSLSIDIVWRQRTIRKLEIKHGDVILDIATGTGDLALLALKENRGCRVVGIDLSGEMLHIATKKRDAKGYRTRYLLVQGDASNIPLKGHSFEHVMVAFGIRNVSNIGRLLREIRRTLKQEGRFAILEFSVPQSHFMREIYLFYFKKILPLLGGLFSRKASAYRYLRDSVMAFHTPAELEHMLWESGFTVLQSLSLWFGICHIFIAKKRMERPPQ